MKAAELARWSRRLSPARRKALDVMRRSHPRPARCSNVTAYATSTIEAYVYWQTARWLIEEGLATWSNPQGDGHLYFHLTPLGVDVAHKAARR